MIFRIYSSRNQKLAFTTRSYHATNTQNERNQTGSVQLALVEVAGVLANKVDAQQHQGCQEKYGQDERQDALVKFACIARVHIVKMLIPLRNFPLQFSTGIIESGQKSPGDGM